MIVAAEKTVDPVELVRQLKPAELRDRLLAIEKERCAIRVLLKAAIAIGNNRTNSEADENAS